MYKLSSYSIIGVARVVSLSETHWIAIFVLAFFLILTCTAFAATAFEDIDSADRALIAQDNRVVQRGNRSDSSIEYVTFWSGDLRIIASENDTEVLLVDIDSGAPLALSDSRIENVNVPANPFVLNANDSFEGIGGTQSADLEIRVKVIASDAGGGDSLKPVVIWSGALSPETRHPKQSPEPGNPWMSYIPSLQTDNQSFGSELGLSFLGFTTTEIYVFVESGESDPLVEIVDVASNVDSDSDDSMMLNADSAERVYADAEISVFYVGGFEDDTIRVNCSHRCSVLAGYSSQNAADWSVSPPSYRLGDAGSELGTLFYTFSHNALTVFPTQDDTSVIITDLSDGDDSVSFTLADGALDGDRLDIYSPMSSVHSPRTSNPAVNIISNNNPMDLDLVKIESDKPVIVYSGPNENDAEEYADVAFSVPTGPSSRVTYTYAQNFGQSNDLQLFAFTPDTEVEITSLSTSCLTNTAHDFDVGPGLIGPTSWLTGTNGADVWWGSGVWHCELLKITSSAPVTVISGDYDVPHFGAFIPFSLSSTTLPPVAILTASEDTINAGQTVTFDGTDSFDQDSVDGGLQPQYLWDLNVDLDSDGDGDTASDVDAVGSVVSTQYFDAGAITAQLTFVDDDGQMDTDFGTIDVMVRPCDTDFNGNVNSDDIATIFNARNSLTTGTNDPSDPDSDGVINVLDARSCTLLCDQTNCEITRGVKHSYTRK